MHKGIFFLSVVVFFLGLGTLLLAPVFGGNLPSQMIMPVAVCIVALIVFGGIGIIMIGALWLSVMLRSRRERIEQDRRLINVVGGTRQQWWGKGA